MFGKVRQLRDTLHNTKVLADSLRAQNQHLQEALKEARDENVGLQEMVSMLKSQSNADVIKENIKAELARAQGRQKRKDGVASDYMKGLQFALKELEALH